MRALLDVGPSHDTLVLLVLPAAVASRPQDRARSAPAGVTRFASNPATSALRSEPSALPALEPIASAPAAMERKEVTPADAAAVKMLQAPPRHVLLVEVKPGPTGERAISGRLAAAAALAACVIQRSASALL